MPAEPTGGLKCPSHPSLGSSPDSRAGRHWSSVRSTPCSGVRSVSDGKASSVPLARRLRARSSSGSSSGAVSYTHLTLPTMIRV